MKITGKRPEAQLPCSWPIWLILKRLAIIQAQSRTRRFCPALGLINLLAFLNPKQGPNASHL